MGREKKNGVGKHSVPEKKSTKSKKELPKKRVVNKESVSNRYDDDKHKEKNFLENLETEVAEGITTSDDDMDRIFDNKIIGMPYGNEGKTKKKTAKKKMSKTAKIVLTVIVVILVVIVSIFSSYIFKSGGSVTEALKSMVKDVVGDQDPIFVLVLGVSEDISAELTDTIMLVGYNPDNNQGFILSIPRDTFIGKNENTAGGFDKINALYQKDPQKTVTAVENLTGIKIDHYVTVKTSVLVKIVDTLGGVEFDVPIDMDYDDTSQDLHIHLKAGPQKLNGDQAEQLVRFRHNNNGTTYSPAYGDNDEGRMRTQREFIKTVASQVTKTRNIDQIKQIISTVFDNLVTNITLNKVVGYVPYVMDIKLDDLQMEQLPGEFTKLNSLWFFKANSSKTEEMINGYIEKLGLTESEKKKYLIEKTSNSTNTKKDTKNTSTTEKTNTNSENSNTTKSTKNTSNENSTKSTTNSTEKSSNTTKSNTTSKNTIKTQENSVAKNTTAEKSNNTAENKTTNNDSSNKNTTTESKTTEEQKKTENTNTSQQENTTGNSTGGSTGNSTVNSTENSELNTTSNDGN